MNGQRAVLAAVCFVAASALLVAQNQFASDYLEGIDAYQKGDMARAEQKLQDSLHRPDTPKGRGKGVLLGSQQYGFSPELYLALIYLQQERYADVVTYAERAKKYVKRSDVQYDLLVNASNQAKRALANPASGDATRSIVPVEKSGPPGAAAGPLYALVIGIDHYDDPTFQTLRTAVADAIAVNDLLRDGFGFQTQLLKDASRHEIITALEAYRRTAGESSSLLIYYAGHGSYDAGTDRAYWLPRDAENASTANWISAREITDNIHAMAARHVIVVSDSCYSGGLTRDAPVSISPVEHDRYVQRAARLKSRHVLSSGALEPVSDAGGGSGHSVFADALLKGLSRIDQPEFTAHELYQDQIAVLVAGRAPQLPQYMPIRESGDEGGDFVFHRRQPR